MFSRIRSTLDAILNRDRGRRELDEEMEFHLDQLARDLMLQGMHPDDARREARQRFGVTEHVHQQSRRARGAAQVDEASRNVRFAFRSMGRSPLLTGAFILTLGLCIGFGTAVFSAVDSVLWKPLPYPDSERLALAGLYNPDQGEIAGQIGVDGATWLQIRDEARDFETAVYTSWIKGVNLSAEGTARFVQQQRVSAGFFRTLGVEPLMGREFSRDEDVPGGPPLVVLSHELWTSDFRADPEILGQSVRLKGELHTVVGVMPAGFRSDSPVDLWTPLRPSTTGEGGGINYTAIVRLPDGMTWDEARARFAAIEPPGRGSTDRIFGLNPLDDALSAGFRVPLLVLLGAVGLMILVGCANLAGIQVSRAVTRQTEMATRQALGCGRPALLRQLTTENLVLGVLGGAVGLGMAVFTLDGLEVLFRTNLGVSASMGIDGRAVAAALGLTTLATVVFGLVPLLQLSKTNALRVLVSGTRGMAGGGSRTLRKVLLVGEVALVTVLLFAGVLLARSYGHLANLEPGFDPSGTLTLQYSLDDARYSEGNTVNRLFDETVAELKRVPGVTHAAVGLSLPYERPLNMPFRLEGDTDRPRPRLANLVYVTPSFFETLGIPLRDGRSLDETDSEDAPGVIVANQALVDAHFEGRTTLGAQVRLGGSATPLELVGVVGDVQQGGGGWGSSQPVWAAPTLYIPVAQVDGATYRQAHIWFSPSWVIRAPVSSPQLASQITAVFERLDSELPVARVASLEQVMAQAFSRTRFQAFFLLVVAGFALLLAGVGLYGIVAQEVVERRREMGVRLALGASPARAVLTTGLAGLRLAAWGLALGALAAVAAGRVIASLVWGVSATDPIAISILVLGIGGLAVVASFVPAARMGRLSPVEALRE